MRLNAKGTAALPLGILGLKVVVVDVSDGDDVLDEGLEVSDAGNGSTVGLTSRGPAGLGNDNGLAVGLGLESVERVVEVLDTVGSSDSVGKEGMDVDTELLGSGNQLGLEAVGGLDGADLDTGKLALDVVDVAGESGSRKEVGLDDLVADHDTVDELLVGTLDDADSSRLLLLVGSVVTVDPDTSKDLHAVNLLESSEDVGQEIALSSGVGADVGNAVLLETLDLGQDLSSSVAATVGVLASVARLNA